MTEAQLTTLVADASAAQRKATANVVLQPYVCGPANSPKGHIPIFVNIADAAPAEIESGIRARLRAIGDIDLVYKESLAQTNFESFEHEGLRSRMETWHAVSRNATHHTGLHHQRGLVGVTVADDGALSTTAIF